MSEVKGLYRQKHANGMEFAFIDKGVGKPFGIPRASYEQQGYAPKYDELPEQ